MNDTSSTTNIQELFGNRLPNFNEDFFEPLFRRYTNWGGGTQEDTAFRGLYFDSGYELFIYAFFLGLKHEKRPIEKEKKTKGFKVPIRDWGKTRGSTKKEYTQIQDYMLMALIARTDIDLNEVQNGDVPVNDFMKSLFTDLDAYANCGLEIITEHLEGDKADIDSDWFVDLLKVE